MKQASTLSRRTFLKGTATAAGALALASQMDFSWAQPLLRPGEEGAAEAEQYIPTACWIGKQDCGMLARVVDGRIVKFEGHPKHPRNLGTLCVKGMSQLQGVYDPYRVKAPLKRTNAKGVSGEWVEISWGEALQTVADEIKKAQAVNKKRFVWQKGRSKAKPFYDDSFVNVTGATKLHHGAYCSDAGYRACEYTTGFHGVLHPDFKQCNYLISWGWNITGAGGNKLCWITWPREFLNARERGMKTVIIDPMRRQAGPFGEKWLPIRPGTDLAFFNALSNILIQNSYLDRPYLTRHTNLPSLVGSDGLFLIANNKEQVWDPSLNRAVDFDKATDPALEGSYTVNGATYRTAFEVFKEHMAMYTPEYAAGVTGLKAEDIREVGLTLGKEARIGSTIVVDGVEAPYRPVGIMGYHVTQQELGFQACRAAHFPFMLVGAFEAAGGFRTDFGRGLYKNWAKFADIEVKNGPYNLYLDHSKFFPINSNNSGIVCKVMLDPEKYEFKMDEYPEAMLIFMSNPLLSFLDQKVFIEAYKKFKFIAAIDPWMSETADYFADIVLPAATIEKYEGPMSVGTQYIEAKTMRIPPIEPLYQSRGDIQIYLDLTEKMGILYGEKGYIAEINKNLKIKDGFKLDVNVKPTPREILDAWARGEGYEGGIGFFEDPEKHVKTKPMPADKYYSSVSDPAYAGARHRIYGASLLKAQNGMKALGAGEIYWQDYTALPGWRPLTKDKSPAEYDLTLISFKKIQFKQSRSAFIPIPLELEPEQRLEINPDAAAARGIADGDTVTVESHNAITGETRRVRTKARVRDYIMPEAVAMSHHYGNWVSPVAKDVGPTPNTLFFTGEGYVENTADQTYHVKVRVFKEVV